MLGKYLSNKQIPNLKNVPLFSIYKTSDVVQRFSEIAYPHSKIFFRVFFLMCIYTNPRLGQDTFFELSKQEQTVPSVSVFESLVGNLSDGWVPCRSKMTSQNTGACCGQI